MTNFAGIVTEELNKRLDKMPLESVPAEQLAAAKAARDAAEDFAKSIIANPEQKILEGIVAKECNPRDISVAIFDAARAAAMAAM